MRAALLALVLLVSASASADQEPARVDVTTTGKTLSFKVVNLSPNPIIRFEVSTRFTSGGFDRLGCIINADVKKPEDLILKGVCSLPTDPATGRPVTYSVQLSRVVFANNLVWTPQGTRP